MSHIASNMMKAGQFVKLLNIAVHISIVSYEYVHCNVQQLKACATVTMASDKKCESNFTQYSLHKTQEKLNLGLTLPQVLCCESNVTLNRKVIRNRVMCSGITAEKTSVKRLHFP